MVAADVVVVGVRVEDHDLAVGELADQPAHVADAEAGVEQQRPLGADDQVRDHLLELARLVDRQHPRADLVDLEPLLALGDRRKGGPGRARQRPPPLVLALAAAAHLEVVGIHRLEQLQQAAGVVENVARLDEGEARQPPAGLRGAALVEQRQRLGLDSSPALAGEGAPGRPRGLDHRVVPRVVAVGGAL